jgi:hypothetical protein
MALPPVYIGATEPIAGENCPFYPDSKNRVGKSLVNAFLVGHTASGIHKTNAILPTILVGTWTGDGTSNKVITLTDPTATIQAIFAWDAVGTNIYFVTSLMTTAVKGLLHAMYWYAFGANLTPVGQFTVYSPLNESAQVYYYAALVTGGYTTTNATPPNWVVHGEQLLGGAAGTEPGNRVEKALYDIYTVEHTDAGTHRATAFLNLHKVEALTFTGTGSAAQVIALADTTMDIKALLLWRLDLDIVCYQTETMAKTRRFDNQLLATNAITLGTGSFTVDGTQVHPEETYVEILSDTSDGDTTFVNSGFSPLAFIAAGGGKHSTDEPHTGATSIKCSASADGIMLYNGGFAMNQIYLGGDFTISVAVHTTTTESVARNIFGLSLDATHYLNLYLDTADAIPKIGIMSGTLSTVIGTTHIHDDSWHVLVISRTAGVISLLVDTISEGTPVVDTTVWQIGGGAIYGNPYGNIYCGCACAGWPTRGGLAYGNQVGYLDDITIKGTNPVVLNGIVHHYLALGV